MIKQVAIGFLDGVDPVEADRWYFRYHSKECVRFFGPWLRRYESYRAFQPPTDAQEYGVKQGRLTELWYDSVDSYIEAKPYNWPFTKSAFTRVTPTSPTAGALVPAMPTEDFLGKAPAPEERPIVRWVYALKYPATVSESQGEKWYLDTHCPEVAKHPGILKFVSHKAIEESPMPSKWLRISEIWFEDTISWRKAILDPANEFTRPPWHAQPPFFEITSIFVGYKPDVDFLKDNPTIP